MKKYTVSQSKFTSAFSLVELLVVIAVIAIIAAIAIPNIGGITGAATTAKHQRNAQSIATTFNNLVAAGYTNTNAVTTAALATALVTSNGTTTNGMTFRVDNITSADVTEALKYLTFSNVTLIPKATTNN